MIVAILPLSKLKHLMAVSRSLGMEPLVEVANAPEMAIALQAGARLIGVNNRDLHTFRVDTTTTNTLAAMIERGEQSNPEDFVVMLAALSGIKSRQDVESYQAAGCEAVLVGETLMRSDNPARTIRELLALPHSPALQPSSTSPASHSHSLSPHQSTASLLQAPNGHSRARSGSLSSIKPVLISPPSSHHHNIRRPFTRLTPRLLLPRLLSLLLPVLLFLHPTSARVWATPACVAPCCLWTMLTSILSRPCPPQCTALIIACSSPCQAAVRRLILLPALRLLW